MANKRLNAVKDKKIVCLGGGIGTVNLIKGLKQYFRDITVVVSMADDGGSAGRLRRFYSIPPPGDLINCIAAMSNAEPLVRDLLTYRFSGNRYGSDRALPGHKLGNLILVALTSLTGDFNKALLELQRIFKANGKILPSTRENVSIWAKTTTGDKVNGEENIDLGKFNGEIDRLYLHPAKPTAPKEAVNAILAADIVLAGPGDLYTTIIPVFLVPDILNSLKKTKAKKIFIVNVANKSFETPNYKINDYVNALVKHCRSKIFDVFLVNSNTKPEIPSRHRRQYQYVSPNASRNSLVYTVVKKDLVDNGFPLYHDSKKLADAILTFLFRARIPRDSSHG